MLCACSSPLTLPLVVCGSPQNVTRADASPARLESLDQQNGHYVANYVCR